jgi:hypothetical protein
MTWAKVDDMLWAHRKVRRAGLEAMGLWSIALSYCRAQNPDGSLSSEDLEHIASVIGVKLTRCLTLAAKLVEAKLWAQTDTGWAFHDWHNYQVSLAYSQAQSAKGKRGAEARWGGARDGPANGTCHSPAIGKADGRGANGKTMASESEGDPKEIRSGARARARPDPDPEPESDTAAGSTPAEAAENIARIVDSLKPKGGTST